MLPTKENGDVISIENVFHSLNTRLNSILVNGNLDSGYSNTESIMDVESKIFGFPAAKALPEINYSLGLLSRIQESKVLLIENDNLIENNGNQIDDLWSNSTKANEQNKINEINEEIAQYKLSLEKLKEEMLIRLNLTESYIVPKGGKIKINIKIEQFGALIYFLYNEKHFNGNVGIFKTDLNKLCDAFSAIFVHSDGKDFGEESLINHVSGFKKNKAVIIFWKEKFIKYFNQSSKLLDEVDK